MTYSLRLIIPVLLFCAMLSHTKAAEWSSTTGTGVKGHPSAYLNIETPQASLGFSCDQRAMVTSKLQMVLFTPSLPNLPAEDDARTVLTFRFADHSGAAVTVLSNPWYFDSDGAWVGEILVDTKLLTVLAGAQSIDILNSEGIQVLTFPGTDAAAGVHLIRQQCKIGLVE